jgi:hypothetical protein
LVSDTSNRDRHYDVLGLKRGASLEEIEDAWRLRSAALHPDKFPAESKEWATGRTQEINNARDELRRYWRERRRRADQIQPEYELHVRRAPPQPDPEPVQAAATRDEPSAAAESPGSIGSPDLASAPGIRRGAVLAYSVVALFVLMALLGASAALLRDDRGDPDLRAMHPEPAREVVMSRPEAPTTALSGERAPATGLTNGDAREVADQIPKPTASAEPPPTANMVVELKEPAVAQQHADSVAEVKEPPSPAAEPDSGVQSPPAPAEPQVLRPAPPQQGRPRPRAQPSQIETSPVPSAAPSSNRAAQQPLANPANRTLLVAAIQACRSDLQRVCPGVQPGGGRIGQCVREHIRELSGGCRQALLALRAAKHDRGNPAGRN